MSRRVTDFRFCLPTGCFDAFYKRFHMLVTFGLISVEIRAASVQLPLTVTKLFVCFNIFPFVVLAWGGKQICMAISSNCVMSCVHK